MWKSNNFLTLNWKLPECFNDLPILNVCFDASAPPFFNQIVLNVYTQPYSDYLFALGQMNVFNVFELCLCVASP